jgi:hypothetical protein
VQPSGPAWPCAWRWLRGELGVRHCVRLSF